jgi:hypothetical protein
VGEGDRGQGADGTMPPWHADPKYGTFVGARG